MEWNSAFTEILGRQYRTLVVSDESGFYAKHKLPPQLQSTTLLVIDLSSQLLSLVTQGVFIRSYQVSTSKRGAGCRVDSGCTPLGWHRIKDKIGDREPAGSVFVGRQVQGIADQLCSDDEDDLITSRILWLDGLQPGLNQGGEVDSCLRYIYIHGTAQEHLIGKAVSHGCVRMRNSEIITLFNQVQENNLVLITHDLADTLTPAGMMDVGE